MMEFKPGDLILVRGNDGISHEIEAISNSLYSHVAGFVKPGELFEAQAFRKVGWVALDTYAGVSDVFTCDIATPEQRQKMIGNVLKFMGKRYSYWLIAWEWFRYKFGWLLPSLSREPLICSVLWAVEAYRSVGIDLCPGIKYPSPGDLAQSKLVRKIGSY